MAYGLAIACGAALAALLVGCYLGRGAGSPVARLLRRGWLFLAPLFLVSLLFSLHQLRLQAAADIVRPAATIGQLEDAIARVGMPPALQAPLREANGTALAAALLGLAVLAFVRPRTPRLGLGRRAAPAPASPTRRPPRSWPAPSWATTRCATSTPASPASRRTSAASSTRPRTTGGTSKRRRGKSSAKPSCRPWTSRRSRRSWTPRVPR